MYWQIPAKPKYSCYMPFLIFLKVKIFVGWRCCCFGPVALNLHCYPPRSYRRHDLLVRRRVLSVWDLVALDLCMNPREVWRWKSMFSSAVLGLPHFEAITERWVIRPMCQQSKSKTSKTCCIFDITLNACFSGWGDMSQRHGHLQVLFLQPAKSSTTSGLWKAGCFWNLVS